MLPPFQSPPIPTFESFVAEKQGKFAKTNIEAVQAALDEVRIEMKVSRLHAASCHPDDPEQAAQSLFDWACKVTTRKMGRELDEVEKGYLREECTIV